MKEPLSLRISDSDEPDRGERFKTILDRKKARSTDVLRALIDAYNATGGMIDFPVRLVSAGAGAAVARAAEAGIPRSARGRRPARKMTRRRR